MDGAIFFPDYGMDKLGGLQLFKNIVGYHYMSQMRSQAITRKTSMQIHDIEFIGYGLVAPTICILGIFLNAFNLCILRDTKHFPESSYAYLFDLALADLLTLLFYCVNAIGKSFYAGVTGWKYFEVYCYFPIGSMASNASVILTVTVTIERFIFMFKPILSKSYCTRQTGKKVIRFIWMFCFIFNIPRFFVMCVSDDGQLAFTNFGFSIYYRIISWIYLITISISSAFCLIIFNSLLIYAIRKRQKALQKKMKLSSEALGGARSAEILTKPNLERHKLISVSCMALDEYDNRSAPINNGVVNPMSTENVDSPKSFKRQKSNSLDDIETKRLNEQGKKLRLLNNLKQMSIFGYRRQQKQREDFALTMTLIAVVVVFLVGEPPSAIFSRNIVGPVMGEEVLRMKEYRILVVVLTALVVCQHSLNFVVYCVLNHKFCAVLKKRVSELVQKKKWNGCCSKKNYHI